MQNQGLNQILTEWSDDLMTSLTKTKSLFVALFSIDSTLLFASPAMHSLFKGDASKSFINPSFEKLLSLKGTDALIFEGEITIGDYTSVNSSIWGQVFLRDTKLLVVGGIDSPALLLQNASMHELNQQIGNLQRQLIKEKHDLANTIMELNEANQELKQLEATKSKFFSIISHDLRGPFSGYLELSKAMEEKLSTLTPVELQKMVTLMRKSADKLYHLLENLLEWSILERGIVPPKQESLNLLHEFETNLELIQFKAQEKQIEIHRHISPDVIVEVSGKSFGSLIRNLLFNAIKFTPKKGIITISAKPFDPYFIEISINDTGIGMDQETINNLFRLELPNSKKGTDGEPGSGLGLLICREFIKKINGKIWVESELGKGSTFHFTLPIIPSNKENNQPLTINNSPPIMNTLQKIKILIAEDDEISELLITKAIAIYSKETLKARTGVEAVEVCRNNPDIDLIMMDIRMPEMNGYEATKQIRHFNKDVIIIAQTAFGQMEFRETALKAGCNDYITKPVLKAPLSELLNKYFAFGGM